MSDVVIELRNVSKTFQLEQRRSLRDRVFKMFNSNKIENDFRALHNINIKINKGEFVAILGRNGSGKSTLLNLMMGSLVPDPKGKIFTKGTVIRLALGVGFDPNLSARENVYVNALIYGMTLKEIGEAFYGIISFAELENFVDVPIKKFSSGMKSRLAFSVAVFAKADVLLIDEFFGGVGDIVFKRKSKDVFENRLINGQTIVHVNHNLQVIKSFADRVIVLEKGSIIYNGDTNNGIKFYKSLNQPDNNANI